jgi:hypothetical protein
MKIPGITSGSTGVLGNIDHANIKAELPVHSTPGDGDSITFKGKPGTDLSTLFNKSADKPAGDDGKGSLTGTAAKLSDATALVPGLSNALKGVGESDGSAGGVLKGVAEGSLETAKNSTKGIVKGALHGEVSMPMMLKNALAENYKQNDQTPQFAKTLAKL